MEAGFTVHSNNRPAKEALERLQVHCKIRKYVEKAKTWYGLCIHPDSGGLRFVIKGEYPWKQSNEMDDLAKNYLLKRKNESDGVKKKNKIGVNDPCPCGSGVKFKKCCKN